MRSERAIEGRGAVWPREDAAPRIEQRRSALRALSSTFARVDARRTSIKELRRDRASLETRARGAARGVQSEKQKKVDRELSIFDADSSLGLGVATTPQSSKSNKRLLGAFRTKTTHLLSAVLGRCARGDTGRGASCFV